MANRQARRSPAGASGAGFTLLELLVVMVIIGMLAAFVAPRYFSQVGKSQVKATRAQIVALEQALDQFRIDVGRYPTSDEGLAVLNRATQDPGWGGPYLKKAVPADPWGRQYLYVYPGANGDFDLYSLGRDGKTGGSGEDADIGNW
ncbi:MAG: type II secretion system major pseudopilin GspG [Steroidobacteraceae bacterium]